jgi:hypothetical protein
LLNVDAFVALSFATLSADNRLRNLVEKFHSDSAPDGTREKIRIDNSETVYVPFINF